uniref:Uncharacterized protein n=1 Tax=Trichuris muris TaxID=70415 RepID=A0A5S6Q770_TRIMR
MRDNKFYGGSQMSLAVKCPLAAKCPWRPNGSGQTAAAKRRRPNGSGQKAVFVKGRINTVHTKIASDVIVKTTLSETTLTEDPLYLVFARFSSSSLSSPLEGTGTAAFGAHTVTAALLAFHKLLRQSDSIVPSAFLRRSRNDRPFAAPCATKVAKLKSEQRCDFNAGPKLTHAEGSRRVELMPEAAHRIAAYS